MNRSEYIFGRIARNLDSENIVVGRDIVKKDVYDAIKVGVDNILIEHPSEKEISLSLLSGTSEYSLTLESPEELYTGENAANETDEANSTTGWAANLNCSLSVSNNERTGSSGEYSIKAIVSGASPQLEISDLVIDDNQYHYLDFWVRGNKAMNLSLYVSNADGDVLSELEIIPVTTSWVNIQRYIYPTGPGTKIMINLGSNTVSDWFEFDDINLTIEAPNALRYNALGEIKAIYPPSTWDSDIQLVDNKNWESIVNASLETSQPLYARRIGHILEFYPVPTAAATVTILMKNHAATQDVSEDIEPETSSLFDFALEMFGTSYLSIQRKEFYLDQYYRAKERAAVSTSRKNYPLAPQASW